MKLFGLEKSSQVSDFRPKDYKNLAMIYKERERERETYRLLSRKSCCNLLHFAFYLGPLCVRKGREKDD